MKRWLILLLYATAIGVAWHYKNGALDWMKSGHAPAYAALAVVTGLAFVPIVPFSVVIGIMGYLYGPLAGAMLSWIGAWIAALAMYGLFRFAFRDRGRALVSRYKGIERWAAMTRDHPFRFVLLSRLAPILPQYAVNIYAAVASIPFAAYAAASAIGKLPAMIIFAFIGRHLSADWHSLLAVGGVYAFFLLAVYGTSRIWARN